MTEQTQSPGPSANLMTSQEQLQTANEIDQVCDEFERDRSASGAEPIEAYLARVEPPQRPRLLRELLLIEWDYADQLDDESLGGFLSRFPQLSHVVEDAWRDDRQRKSQPADVSAADTDVRLVEGDTHSQAGPDSLKADEAWSLPEEFGRYRIIQRIASGGMGSVYLAQDTVLDRRVALKTPHNLGPQQSELIERFAREAQLMAALQHPNICPVYDVGEHEGQWFITMAFVEGKTLDAHAKAKDHVGVAEAVGIVRRLAVALAEAHELGVVHRDLKPSNVMIDRRGEPVVMDFGLAVNVALEDARITAAGTIVGTPLFMSPEQVEGIPEKIGPATDIYSLGVILYWLLTGQAPFAGSPTQVMTSILRDPPPAPSSLRPEIDAELEAICLTAMAKPSEERFSSMTEFAQALDTYTQNLTLRPSTSPASAPPRSRAWPWWCLAAALPLLLLAAILLFRTPQGVVRVEIADPETRVEFAGQTLTILNDKEPIQITPGEKQTLVIQRGELRFETAKFTLGRGDNPKITVELLDDKLAAKLGEELLGEWPVNNAEPAERPTDPPQVVDDGEPAWASGPPENVLPGLIARPAEFPGVKRWNVMPVYPLFTSGYMEGYSISPDSKHFAIASGHYLWIYGLPSLTLDKLISSPTKIRFAQWSPDGRVIGGTSGTQILMWDVETSKLAAKWEPELPFDRSWRTINWNSDGEKFATGGYYSPKAIKIWDKNGQLLQEFDSSGPNNSLAWSSDGKWFACASDPHLRVWNAETWELEKTVDFGVNVGCVEFSPNSKLLAATSMIRDGQPCFAVWEVRTWKSKADVPEFEHGAGPISWATDDRIAMAAHGIRIWDFAEKKFVHSSYPSDAHGYFGRRVHYSKNGRWLIYGDPFVSEVYDVEKGQTIGRLQTSGNATRAMAYSDDGDLIAVGTDANTLQVIDAATGRLVNLFDGHTDSVTAVSFHPHGNTLISGGEDKAIRVWSLENHRLKKTLTGHESTVSSLDWHRVQSRW